MVLLFSVFCFLSLYYQVYGNYGIISAVSSSQTERKFCMIYSKNIGKIPSSALEAKAYPLVNLFPWDDCDPPLPEVDVHDKIVIIKRFTNKSCSYEKQAAVIELAGGAGVIMVDTKNSSKVKKPVADSETNETQITNATVITTNNKIKINITLAIINDEIYNDIKSLGPNVTVKIYGPEVERVDYSLIAIWLMAVMVVTIGCFWGGIIHYQYIQRRRHSHRPRVTPESSSSGQPRRRRKAHTKVFMINVLLITLLVLLMCGLLLLLYFFYSYLVYVIIALFSIASTIAVFQILDALIKMIPSEPYMLPRIKIRRTTIHIAVYQVFLAVGCIGFTIYWVIIRNDRYGWICQNILGMFFCVNILRTLRLPNAMICTVLMVLLFFYDIFFVFITPLFTKSGESIMVHVATGGGGTEEQLPMVFKFPHLRYVEVFDVCQQQEFSLLGFGDILVPGLFVSFLHGFDMEIQSRRIYFISGLISYSGGLILTFVGMYMMRTAQPALLYLVPCTLIPVFIISLIRHELKALWMGNAQLVRGRQVPTIATTPQSERIGDNPSPTSNEENQLIRE